MTLEGSLEAQTHALLAAFKTPGPGIEDVFPQMRAYSAFALEQRRLRASGLSEMLQESKELVGRVATLLDRVDATLRQEHSRLTLLLELGARHSSDISSAPSAIKQHAGELELTARALTLYDDVAEEQFVVLKATARAFCPAMSALMIEGELGSGKTTLLATLHGEERTVSSRSTRFVSLSSIHADAQIDEALAELERDSCGAGALTTEAVRTWYLDALDELAPLIKQRRMIAWVSERNGSGARFVVSSRRSRHSLVVPFTKVVLGALDLTKIRE
jgi:hypothetical protein